MLPETDMPLQEKLSAVVALAIEKRKGQGKRTEVARAIGRRKESFLAWLRGGYQHEISLLAVAKALQECRVDLASLIEREIMGGEPLDGLPEPVKAYLEDPRTKESLSEEQYNAIFWLAKAGVFGEQTTGDELNVLWQEMKELSGKGGASHPPKRKWLWRK